MWPEVLIALGLAIILGVAVRSWVTRGGGKAERHRARAKAEAAGARHEPIPEAEQQHADEMRALADEHRTGEQRIVRKQQHLTSVAAIARKYRRTPKHAAAKLPGRGRRGAKQFDPLTSPMPVTEQAVMVPGRKPIVWDLPEFTEEWERGAVDRMVADYEAREAANR